LPTRRKFQHTGSPRRGFKHGDKPVAPLCSAKVRSAHLRWPGSDGVAVKTVVGGNASLLALPRRRLTAKLGKNNALFGAAGAGRPRKHVPVDVADGVARNPVPEPPRQAETPMSPGLPPATSQGSAKGRVRPSAGFRVCFGPGVLPGQAPVRGPPAIKVVSLSEIRSEARTLGNRPLTSRCVVVPAETSRKKTEKMGGLLVLPIPSHDLHTPAYSVLPAQWSYPRVPTFNKGDDFPRA